MSNDLSIRVAADVVTSSQPNNTVSNQAYAGTIASKERYLAVDDAERVSRHEEQSENKSGIDDAEKVKVVSEYVQQAQSISRDLEFSIDEELGKTIITVSDAKTEQIIRKIPSDEALQLARTLVRNDGVLLKTKA